MFNYLVGALNPQTTIMLVLLAIMVIVLIVLPMFTNRRRSKAIMDLHSSLRPGDEIKTVGGIVGTIVEIKDISPVDKIMVIETGVGDNKSTMVFDIQAVYQVLKKIDAPAPEVTEQAEATADAEAPVEQVAQPENEPTEEKAEESVAAEEPVQEKVEEPIEQEAPVEQSTEQKAAPAKKPRAKK